MPTESVMRFLRLLTLLCVSLFVVLGTAGPGAAATTPKTKTLKGTVVHRSKRAHSFTVANARGVLSAVHATKLPPLGRAVTVQARALQNGTYEAVKVKVGAKQKRSRIRGVVTY